MQGKEQDSQRGFKARLKLPDSSEKPHFRVANVALQGRDGDESIHLSNSSRRSIARRSSVRTSVLESIITTKSNRVPARNQPVCLLSRLGLPTGTKTEATPSQHHGSRHNWITLSNVHSLHFPFNFFFLLVLLRCWRNQRRIRNRVIAMWRVGSHGILYFGSLVLFILLESLTSRVRKVFVESFSRESVNLKEIFDRLLIGKTCRRV